MRHPCVLFTVLLSHCPACMSNDVEVLLVPVLRELRREGCR
jgi:hypothetical protein